MIEKDFFGLNYHDNHSVKVSEHIVFKTRLVYCLIIKAFAIKLKTLSRLWQADAVFQIFKMHVKLSRNRKLSYFADRTIDKNCMTNRRN